ncbi:MAG: hypothetical protein K1W21_12540, partial [Oscillospiraceae bacterium]
PLYLLILQRLSPSGAAAAPADHNNFIFYHSDPHFSIASRGQTDSFFPPPGPDPPAFSQAYSQFSSKP